MNPFKSCQHPSLTDDGVRKLKNKAAILEAQNTGLSENVETSKKTIKALRAQINDFEIIEKKYQNLMMKTECDFKMIAQQREEIEYFKSRETETMEVLNQVEGLIYENRELREKLQDLKELNEKTRTAEVAQQALQALRQRRRSKEQE